MTKVVIRIASLVILATLTWGLHAQSTPADTAVEVAVKKEADTIKMRQTLAQAQTALQQKDLSAATKLFEEAWSLVVTIGPSVESDAVQVKAGLATARLQLAQQAVKANNLKEADIQVSRVLKVDPANVAAQDMKRQIAALQLEQAGMRPSEEIGDQIHQIQTNHIRANTLVQDGKILLEMGKVPEAEVKFRQASEIEPSNIAAMYYIALVQEGRYRQLVGRREAISKEMMVKVEELYETSDKRNDLPVPNPWANTNLIFTSKGRQNINNKLNLILLEEVKYDKLPLGEVVRLLKIESQRRDPEKKGINFMIAPHADTAVQRTQPNLQNLLNGGVGGPGAGGPGGNPGAFQGGAFPPVQLGPDGLPIAQPAAAAAEAVDLGSVIIQLELSHVSLAEVLDAIVKVADQPIKFTVEDYAVYFTVKAVVQQPLYTRFFKIDPNTFYQGLDGIVAGGVGQANGGANGGGGGGGFGGGGNGGGGGGFGGGGGGGGFGGGQQGGGGTTGAGGGGGGTIARVDVTAVSSFGGGNFGGGGGGGRGGQQGGGFGGGQQQGGGFGGQQGQGGGGGGGVGGLSGVTTISQTTQISAAARLFFATLGVDLDFPKAVFFNDRSGLLMVHASMEDLQLIEDALHVLNASPPQLKIEAKFLEIGQNDTKALGFNWWLGGVNLGNGKIIGTAGTQPSLNGSPSIGNPAGTFPGALATTSAGTAIDTLTYPSSTDGLLTSGLRNTANAPVLATITGILTDPQFRVAIAAMEKRDGTDLVSAPTVTTLSGRQAHMEVTDLATIVTGSGANQTGAGGGAVGAGAAGGAGAVATTIVPTTTQIPLGPVLDVMPTVSADGFSVQMTILPTITEFLGYDDPGPFIIQAQSVGGIGGASQPLTAILPLPRLRVRQVVTSAVVWDGQTVVLGGLISENVQKVKDKVPVLGDLPMLGKLFRSESSTTQKKNLVIFVTPTIIDPAGNPLHSDDDMPFRGRSVPPQVPVTQ